MLEQFMTQQLRVLIAMALLALPVSAHAHHDELGEHIWHELTELLSHPEVLAIALAAVAGVWWLLRRRRNAKRGTAH